MLGFSTAGRELASRDSFIGWTPQLREKNFPLVIDNPRFLTLPWITIPNLGSHILSLVRRQLPEDWTRALQHHARAHRDLRRGPALHRRALQGFRLDTRRNHQGTRPIRLPHQTRSVEEGHLAPAHAQGLAAHSQPVRSRSSVIPCGPSSRRGRTSNHWHPFGQAVKPTDPRVRPVGAAAPSCGRGGRFQLPTIGPPRSERTVTHDQLESKVGGNSVHRDLLLLGGSGGWPFLGRGAQDRGPDGIAGCTPVR